MKTVSQKQTEWISVKERLPKAGHRYMICTKGKTVTDSFYGYDGKWEPLGSLVAHWQPMIEPAKDEVKS